MSKSLEERTPIVNKENPSDEDFHPERICLNCDKRYSDCDTPYNCDDGKYEIDPND